MSDVEKLGWDLTFNMSGGGLQQALAGVGGLNEQLLKGRKLMLEFESGGQRMKATFGGVGEEAQKAKQHLDAITVSLHHFTAGVGGMSVSIAGPLGAVLGLVKEVAHGIGEAFKSLDEFGNKAFEANAERVNTLRAYTALLGDSKKAQEEFAWDQNFGAKAPFKTAEIEALHKRMIASGTMNPQEARAGTLAITDLAALQGGEAGEKALGRGAAMYAEIGEQGVNKMHLRQISGDLSMSTERIVHAAAKLTGRSDESIQQGIHKQEFANAAGGKLFQRAIQEATLDLLGTSKLGEYSEKSAGSLQTMQINQGEEVKRLIKSFDSELLPGVIKYKNALTEQAVLFDANSDEGHKMALTLESLIDTSANVKAAWEQFTTGFEQAFSESYNAVLEILGQGRQEWDATGQAARGLGITLGNELGGIVAHLTGMLHSMAWPLERVDDLLTGIIVPIRVITKGFINLAELLLELVRNPFDAAGASQRFLQKNQDAWNWEISNIADKNRMGYRPDFDFVTGGTGEAPPSKSAIPDALKRPEKASHGGGGGGGGGPQAFYTMDGLDALVARDLATDKTQGPGVVLPGFQGPMEMQRSLSAGLAAARQQDQQELAASLAWTGDWTGDIVVQGGDHDVKEIADEVEDRFLRRVCRFARTPSPKRT